MGADRICTGMFLLAASWTDWRRREISLPLTFLFMAAGIAHSIAGNRPAADYLAPAGIGILFLCLGILTEGALGMGDGLVLLALGTAMDTGAYLGALLRGILLAAAWSGTLLAVFRKDRKTEIPFVPFLLTGYLGGVLL